jgi:hypothetical protein
VAGVEAYERSTESAWTVRGDEGADEELDSA